jgi:hypothetical protein
VKQFLIFTALLVTFAGCGESSRYQEVERNPEQIAREAGFSPKRGYRPNAESGFIGPSGCSIAVILNSPARIALYGGPENSSVVTDSSESVGAKIGEPWRCASLIEERLNRVR